MSTENKDPKDFSEEPAFGSDNNYTENEFTTETVEETEEVEVSDDDKPKKLNWLGISFIVLFVLALAFAGYLFVKNRNLASVSEESRTEYSKVKTEKLELQTTNSSLLKTNDELKYSLEEVNNQLIVKDQTITQLEKANATLRLIVKEYSAEVKRTSNEFNDKLKNLDKQLSKTIN